MREQIVSIMQTARDTGPHVERQAGMVHVGPAPAHRVIAHLQAVDGVLALRADHGASCSGGIDRPIRPRASRTAGGIGTVGGLGSPGSPSPSTACA